MVNYAPSGLWSVGVRESEKVLMEASDVIGEVQRYLEALYAKRPVNLPAFERLVRAHIPRGVPEEWRSVQDYTLQDLKDAVTQAVADDKAPGSNRVFFFFFFFFDQKSQFISARGHSGPSSK